MRQEIKLFLAEAQSYLVFDFDLHKLTFSYGRSRAQLAPTEDTIHRYKVNV